MNGTLWFLATLLPFLLVQRWLHRQIQILLLIITRDVQWVMILFSLVFLPGVFVHEASHFLVARLLGVRTTGFSVIPRVLPNGNLQLGAVKTERTDFLRDAIIGTAPLLVGGGIVALIAIFPLQMLPMADAFVERDWRNLAEIARQMPDQPDFWLWFYLAFTTSSTMVPSASDRRAWLPVLLVVLIVLGFALLAGAGGWLSVNVAPLVDRGLASASMIFLFGAVVHLAIGFPIQLLVHLTGRVAGFRVR